MNRFWFGSLAVLSLSVAAAPLDGPAAIDAFLSQPGSQKLVAKDALSSRSRAALSNGFITSTEPRYGVPTFFWSTFDPRARGPRDSGLTPSEAARQYVVAHAELYRASAGRWAEAQVSNVHDLKDGTAVIVTFQQRINGVRVFRDELKVIMTSNLQLVALSGYLTPATKVRGTFALDAKSAIGSAALATTGRELDTTTIAALGQFSGGYSKWKVAGALQPARTRPVYFPMPSGLVPAFYVELNVAMPEAGNNYSSYVVSAVDGRVLYRKNLTAHEGFTYKVWADPVSLLPHDGPQGTALTPNPLGAPGVVSETMQTQSTITINHGPISTNDPWLPSLATDTNGNNTVAYADLARSNGFGSGDVIADATAGAFDFTYDFALDPQANATQEKAAVTQLFYDNNFFHDWYYDDGFNEAAGNAQASNLNRGGLAGDVMLSEAQDYSGTDNANMSTPADGESPQMQMYIFTGASGTSLTFNSPTPRTFNTQGASFGPQTYNVTAELVLANDGDATPTDGCAVTWPTSFAGKVVLIDRGTCSFQDKVLHAQGAGAVAVIIANNAAGGPIALGSSPGAANPTIPAMGISQTSGTTLKGLIGGGQTVTLAQTPSIDRDGTLDNGVVAHEWGHYISNRLIGDANGISNLQAVGMGEGWGDFHAALLIAREEDAMNPVNANWRGAFALAGYAGATVDPAAYYFGFRRYPISADFAKNPLMFKHIQDGVALPAASVAPLAFGASGADNSQVHNTGEVWAAMLWECYVTLLTDPRYTFEQARSRMKKDLVGAYKATPLMPTFIDARDAVLAVTAASDMTDFANFWAAFARRGIGMGATAPDRDSQDNSPVHESIVVGNDVQVVDVAITDDGTSCDHDGVLDAFETGTLTIKLRNTGVGTLTAASVALTTSTAGVTFPSGATRTMAPTAPFGTATITVPVALGDVSMPQAGVFTIAVTDSSLLAAVSATANFRLNYDLRPNSSRLDDVEAPMTQWTAANDPQGVTGSDFRIFQSTATEHFWFGPNPSAPADTYLISPALNVGAGDLTVTFKHRWDFEADDTENYDGAVIEISEDDGMNWVDVGAMASPGYTGTISDGGGQSSNPLGGRDGYVGQSDGYPAFLTETVALGAAYADKTVKFRFRIGSDDAAAAKGWEIDDIAFNGTTNLPFTSVVSDPNSCSNGAPTLVVGADQVVNEGQAVTLTATATDPDGDPLTFTWVQTSGPMVTLSGADFTAPTVDAETVLTFQVTVTDGRAVSLPLEQKVTVRDQNLPPVASAPAVVQVVGGGFAQVTGTGTDPEGEAVTFEWTQVSGDQVALTGIDSDRVFFTAPRTAQTIRLQLVVRDSIQPSEPVFVDFTITANEPPPAKTGCGCMSGVELLPVALLGLVLRSRRRKQNR